MDKFYRIYKTPADFSDMIMYSDGEFLTGLVFNKPAEEFRNRWDKRDGDLSRLGIAERSMEMKELPVFAQTEKWLDLYFGKDPESGEFTGASRWPDFVPAIRIEGLTPFRRKVIAAMISIPYGQTMTYGDIAKAIGKETMSARAVGGAVGWNPISLIIPCHRVLGTNGSITGYGGGTENKMALLRLEGTLL